MAIWNKFYLNKHGELYCPGDNCKHKCDEKCPIWLNTLAMTCKNSGNNEQAILLFKKASELVPNETAYLTNIGFCYGAINDFENAYLFFKKSYDICNNNEKLKYPLKGIIYSLYDLNKKEEAEKYINEYKELYGELDSGIINRINQNSSQLYYETWPDFAYCISIVQALLDGMGEYNPVIRPSISTAACTYVSKILQNIEAEEKLCLIAFVYAGIAFELSVRKNKANNLLDMLLESKDAFSMIEKITTNIIGYDFRSVDSDKIKENVDQIVSKFNIITCSITSDELMLLKNKCCIMFILSNILCDKLIDVKK